MTTFASDLLKDKPSGIPPISVLPTLGKGVTLDDLPGDDGTDETPAIPDSRTPSGLALDDFIAKNRLVTPPEVVNKRSVPRSTIAELNQTDPDALRTRLLSMRRDDRSPVIKVLDLLDAPRNIILSHLAPKLRVAAQERGDTGAFGLGRVNFSDVLRELGVTNRVAAGLLGFVGDVLFDPLTYVGPAGWGAELASKTAQGSAKVGLRAAGTKALKREIAKVAAGSAEIGDDVARAYLHAKGFTPERIAALAGTGLKPHEIQSRIAKATFGDPSRSIVERMFRPLGGERTFGVVDEIPEDLRGLVTTPGGLADDFMRSEGPVSDAARAFVEKYVAGGGKALRIGTGGEIGTQVAHIPFLSQYTLQVPRFTHGATINARNLALAKSAALGVSDTVGAASDPLVQLTHRIADTTAGVHQDLEARVAERAQHEELRKNLSDDLPPSPPPPPDAGGPTGPVGPQPTPIVPGMDDGLSLPPNAPERTSNFIVDSAAATPAPRPEQGRIAFDIDARAQEILDNGDALDEDDARHMAQIEAAAWERNNPPTTETAGGPTSTTPSPTAGGLPGAGATGDANVLEEGRQKGREGLLSPPAAATTTPPAVDEAAGGVAGAKEPWEMTYTELSKAIDPDNADSLQAARPLLATVFPEYVGAPKPGNPDPWNIGRAIERGDELPRVPKVDLSQRHRRLILKAIEDGRTVPPQVLAEYPGLVKPITHRERVMGEARAAFADRPTEELDAFAALVDARAKAMVKSGQIKTPEELWSTFSVAKGADGKNVLYQSGDPDKAPIWYSKLSSVVNEKLGGSADAAQLRAMLQNNGVKPEEMEWARIGDLKGKVTKQQVLDHLAENAVRVKEIELGSPPQIVTTQRTPGVWLVHTKDARPQSAAQAIGSIDRVTKDGLERFDVHLQSEGTTSFSTFDKAQEYAEQGVAARARSSSPTKFSQYTLPGGTDYRELLLTLPEKQATASMTLHRDQNGQFFAKHADGTLEDLQTTYEPAAEKFLEHLGRERQIKERFASGHFDEPNVLAHVRFDTRTDAQGKKVLFIEEIQSDWHQKGREKGYRPPLADQKAARAQMDRTRDRLRQIEARTAELDQQLVDGWRAQLRVAEESASPENRNLADQMNDVLRSSQAGKMTAVLEQQGEHLRRLWGDKAAELDRLAQEELAARESIFATERKLADTVPDAPFKKTWHELAMKRMIRYASENGYDRVAWTTGAQQAERYDLSKQVEKIVVEAPGEAQGVHFVDIAVRGQGAINLEVENGIVRTGEFEGKQLSDVIGKDMAEQILSIEAGANKTFSGLDLKVGGEGMRGFYDQMLVTDTNKLIKRHGGRVGIIELASQDSAEGSWDVFNAHGFDITQSMKQDALVKGMPLFQGRGEPRASIRWEDGHAFIRALKSPNVSSLFHETGHLFLPTLTAAEHAVVAKVYKVDPKLLAMTSVEAKKTPAQFKKWVTAHEQWANDFEQYLSSGKAPTPELQSIFDKMKQWFIDLYKQIVGSPLEKEIDPKIRGVMDRMLGGVDDGSGLATPSGKVTRSVVWDRLRDSTADARGIISDMEMVADESMQDFAHATVFHEMPTELKMALQRPGGDSLRRQFIRIDPTRRSGGWDAIMDRFGGDAEKYVDWLEELAGSEKSKVLRAARMSEQQGNPAAPFWLALWEHWPVKGRKATVAKMDTIDAATIGPDVAFSFHGMPLRTMQNEDGAVVIAYEGREVPAELVGSLPVDPGSVRRLTEEEIAAIQGVDDTNLYQRQRDVGGQGGLFGNRVGKIGDGREQGSLFGPAPEEPKPIPVGEPERMLNESDDAYKARLAQHRKWAESARNTGTLFQDGPDPNTLPLGNLPPRSAEDARWSEREKQIESAIGEKLSHLRMLKQESDDALAAFEAASAAGEVSNMNDVLRIGEMLGDAQAAVDDAISANHLSQMMVAATTPDATGLRLIDTGDPADLAEQLGEHLYHLAVTDPDAAEQLAEAARARMEAAMNYRESLRSTLQAVSDRQTGHMADLAKAMLSTDDESIALSAFGPVARFLGERFGIDSKAYAIADGMDRFWRRTFGVRRGFVHQAIAETRGQYSKGSISERMHATARLALKAQGLDIPGVPANEATHLLYLWTVQRLDPERLRFFWNKIGKDGQDLGKSDLLLALDKFQGAGGFSPESQAKLNAAADEFIAEMRSMGLSEQSQGILGLIRDPYLPAKATDESQKAMFEHAAAGSVGKGDKAGWPTQGFQRAKTTDQVRYPDPLNPKRTRRFFVGQMYLADTPDKHLDQEALSIKRAVVDYLEMAKADPAFAMAHQPRPTDALELNALYSEGTNFQHLTGGKPLEQLFDTDLATLYGKRMGDHVRAQSMQDLGRIVLAQGYQIGDMLNLDANGAKVGMTGKLRGGTDVTLAGLVPSNMGGQAHGVRIGDTLYRRLDPKIWNSMDDNVFAQMLGRLPVKMDDLVLHHAVADQIEDVVKLGSPDQLEKILRAADNITGLWKQLTLFHPSWVVGNIVGDTMNAVVGGADPRDMADPRLVRDMIRLRTSMHDPSKIKDMVVTLKTGQEIPAQELLRTFVDHRIIDNNLTAEAMVAIGKQNPGLFSALNDRALSRVVGPWFKANQHVQDVMRMTAFVSFLNQGHDAISAQRHVLRSMFDYGDFTRVEERAFRRLFPFYSWMRNNIGYQVAMLGQRPSYAALMSKLQPALEELMAGEGAVPDGQRPSWLRNALAVQVGTDPNHRFALTLGTLLPQGDLLQVLSPILGTDGALNFMHYFSSNLTPNLTVPLQLGTGTEFFSGRSIGGDNLSGDMSAGEMLRSQVRPLAEIGNISRAYQQGGVTQAIGRGVLGGRIQSFDQNRLDSSVRREFRDREERLRSAIRRAERRGDSDTSLEARARLMDLYRDALKRGLEDVVPAWAEEQLAQLTE